MDQTKSERRKTRLKRRGLIEKKDRKSVKLKVIQNSEKISEQEVKYKWDGRRPNKREDCEFCHICQLWREGSIEDTEVLACGHSNQEAIFHTRPCVFVACKHNLFLDVSKSGTISVTRENSKPEDMKESCVLDEVEDGGLDCVKIGELMNIHRVRVEQIEKKALDRIRKSKNIEARKLRDMNNFNEEDYNEEEYSGIHS